MHLAKSMQPHARNLNYYRFWLQITLVRLEEDLDLCRSRKQKERADAAFEEQFAASVTFLVRRLHKLFGNSLACGGLRR
jgi:hypothetical protein